MEKDKGRRDPAPPTARDADVSFTGLLLAELPRMRGHAIFLTRTAADADDLIQQTALRALKAQHQFTMGTNLRAWLYRIMRNEFIDKFRQTKGQVSFGEMPDDLLVGKATQEDRIETREVVTAMKRLSPLLLEVMLLVPGRGLSYQEAADIQGCSVGTIKSRLSRARTKLQGFLTDTPEKAEA